MGSYEVLRLKSYLKANYLGSVRFICIQCDHFGEIFSLWQLFFPIFWQNFELTFVIFYAIRQICSKWPDIEKNIAIWQHCS